VLDISQSTIGRSNTALQENILQDVRRHSMPEIPLSAPAPFRDLDLSRYHPVPSDSPILARRVSLLWGMIEAWAHLFFIADESEPDSSALRAIRFEAGVLSEWASVRKKMEQEIDYDQLKKRNHDSIMKLWAANEGINEPRRRTYKDVNTTLAKMAKMPELESLGIIHAASSVAVNSSAADFLLESN
jgi:hypothetical protein